MGVILSKVDAGRSQSRLMIRADPILMLMILDLTNTFELIYNIKSINVK